MIDKKEWLSIQSIIEYLIIAFVYIIAALATSFAVKDLTLPFYHAISTGLMAGVIILKGGKSILGFLIGAVVWQLITITISLNPLQLSLASSFIFIFSEGITLIIIVISFQSFSNINSLIEQNSNLKRFFITAILAPIPQAIILATIFYRSGDANSSLSYNKLINILWLSITVSILSISPFVISFINTLRTFKAQDFVPSWELSAFLFLIIVPNTLEILNITAPPYSFPIHYLVFPAIFVIAFRRESKTLASSILIFYLVTIYAASTNPGNHILSFRRC